MIVAKGYCPRCKSEWSPEEAARYVEVTGVVTLFEATRGGGAIRCMICRRRITADVLSGRSRKPVKREAQIRLVNDEGKLLNVYYGATHGIKKELAGKKGKLPEGFKGSGTALAEKLGMSSEDLAVHLGMSIEELSTVRLDLGKSKLEKAEPNPT